MPSRALTSPNRAYAMGLARAFAGAIIFGLPLLMTMEMWCLGISLHPARLLALPRPSISSSSSACRASAGSSAPTRWPRMSWTRSRPAASASSARRRSCWLLAIIDAGDAARRDRRQDRDPERADELRRDDRAQAIQRRRKRAGGRGAAVRGAGYGGQLFLMAAGALFLSFNVAPTEEMVLIAYMMSTWHLLALILVSLLLLHALRLSASASPARRKLPDGLGSGSHLPRLHDPRLRHRARRRPLRAMDVRPDRRHRGRPGRGDDGGASPSRARWARRSRGWWSRGRDGEGRRPAGTAAARMDRLGGRPAADRSAWWR